MSLSQHGKVMKGIRDYLVKDMQQALGSSG